jgi:hypothetical protein
MARKIEISCTMVRRIRAQIESRKNVTRIRVFWILDLSRTSSAIRKRFRRDSVKLGGDRRSVRQGELRSAAAGTVSHVFSATFVVDQLEA